MKYSVIDISSSSISMIVADMNDRITEIIFRDRASLTLLHYLDGHDLSQRGIDKLVEAVSVMKDKCVSLGVDAVYLISTAALRAVGNFEEIGAAILNRTAEVLGVETDGYTHTFTDVSGHWVSDSLGWPVHAGIINGVGDNRFDPDGVLTTEQSIVMAQRALEALSISQ